MSLEVKSGNKISYSTKKFFQKEVPKLNKNEYQEIFNIVKLNNDAKYSENSAGVYINLKYLNQTTIEKMMDFIKYTKSQKNRLKENKIDENKLPDKSISSKLKNNITTINSQAILNKRSVEKELTRLRDKKKESFVFQNFLDKLSISNIKQFSNSDEAGGKIIYPQLKQDKIQFNGVKARLLKKCRDVNKLDNDLPFISNDEYNYEDTKFNYVDQPNKSQCNEDSKKHSVHDEMHDDTQDHTHDCNDDDKETNDSTELFNNIETSSIEKDHFSFTIPIEYDDYDEYSHSENIDEDFIDDNE